ncbi:MAG: hypothetical protein AAF612_12800 [Planctomycetota bacterium]
MAIRRGFEEARWWSWLVGGALGLMLAVSAVGCGGPSEAAAESEAVSKKDKAAAGPGSVSVRNRTSGEVTQVAGKFGASMSFGSVDKGDEDTLSGRTIKFDKRVSIYWTDARGDRYDKSWDPGRELGKGFHGAVRVTLHDGGKATLSVE